jgi:hypothetical protein
MGKIAEWIEASSDDRLGSCETHSKNLSSRQKKNRGCHPCTLGKVQSGEEEVGCLDPRKPARESRGGLSFLKPSSSERRIKSRGGANSNLPS